METPVLRRARWTDVARLLVGVAASVGAGIWAFTIAAGLGLHALLITCVAFVVGLTLAVMVLRLPANKWSRRDAKARISAAIAVGFVISVVLRSASDRVLSPALGSLAGLLLALFVLGGLRVIRTGIPT